MESSKLLSSKHSPPWNTISPFIHSSQIPTIPLSSSSEASIFPSASDSDEARLTHYCMFLLNVCTKGQTDTQMGRQTVASSSSFFPPPCDFSALLFKKLILFHSPLIKSQSIPRVHCLLRQHPALDLAFSSSEGSDDVFSHVWCLAFRIKCSFLHIENREEVNSSPEHVGFEVGGKKIRKLT